MVTAAEPLAIYQVAENLRECVHNRLATTPAGAPDRSCVISGAIAWDDCECGQFVVSIGQSYFSSNFPAQGSLANAPGNRRCGPPILVVQYTLSILRCAPIGGDDLDPPTCAALDEAARIAEYDAWAVRFGAHCCLSAWSKCNDPDVSISDFEYRGQARVGPEGACQGSELVVLVGLTNACPPCDDVEM